MAGELVWPVEKYITEFISYALQDSQSIDDCREVLKLTCIFFPRVDFSVPDNVRHGRWMVKIFHL